MAQEVKKAVLISDKEFQAILSRSLWNYCYGDNYGRFQLVRNSKGETTWRRVS